MERETAAEEPAAELVRRAGPPADHRAPKHARSWPVDPAPLLVMAAVTVVAICAMIYAISDGADPGPRFNAIAPRAASPSRPADTAPPPEESAPAASATSSPRPSASATTPRPKPTPVTAVALSRPRHGQDLDEDRDFLVEGIVRDLGDDDLRVFIYAERRRTFYLADYHAEDIDDGYWAIRSAGIDREWGRDGDPYLVLAVQAGPSCQESLDGLDLSDDRHRAFSALPDGCRVLAQVRVFED